MSEIKTPSLIIDASAMIGLCAREPDKLAVVEAEWIRYAEAGYHFYAPGVIISEVLFVLCSQLSQKKLSEAQHAAAVEDFRDYMQAIDPPPCGDRSLVLRAERLRAGYGCSRSNDSLYLALAEELAGEGEAEILTFDAGYRNQGLKTDPPIKVRLLVAKPAMGEQALMTGES